MCLAQPLGQGATVVWRNTRPLVTVNVVPILVCPRSHQTNTHRLGCRSADQLPLLDGGIYLPRSPLVRHIAASSTGGCLAQLLRRCTPSMRLWSARRFLSERQTHAIAAALSLPGLAACRTRSDRSATIDRRRLRIVTANPSRLQRICSQSLADRQPITRSCRIPRDFQSLAAAVD